MKRSLLALAALTAFAGAASAQSSVTLFGIVDVNARNVKNGSNGDISGLNTDGNASSRLGFRGVEDLGGGLRAGFWLEAAVTADNGTIGGGNGGATANAASTVDPKSCTANTTTGVITCPAATNTASASSGGFFNRRSTVSLLGNFGEVRLGRDYIPTFWNHTVFDVFGTNGVASATNLITVAPGVAPFGTAQTLVRANNAIGYFLPQLGGFYGQITVAAGEKQVPGNKYTGGRFGYGAGPFNAAIAYGVTEQPEAALGDIKAMNIGASWAFSFMTLMGQYNKYEQEASGTTTAKLQKDLENYSLGVIVPFGASSIKASYGETKFKDGAGNEPKATQIGLGYLYDLSKRTTLYVHYSQIDNDAGLAFIAGTGGPATTGLTNGFKSTGYEFGIRHSF